MSDSDAERPSSFRVWFVTCTLFLAILAGGSFLAVYMLFPAVADAQPWLPIAGMALVCLPWLFWLITFVYHVVSRFFRYPPTSAASASRGKGGAPAAGNSGAAEGKEFADSLEPDPPAVGAGRHVRFGGAVVVDDGEATPTPPPGDSGNQESSTASHDSETPLALCMAP